MLTSHQQQNQIQNQYDEISFNGEMIESQLISFKNINIDNDENKNSFGSQKKKFMRLNIQKSLSIKNKLKKMIEDQQEQELVSSTSTLTLNSISLDSASTSSCLTSSCLSPSVWINKLMQSLPPKFNQNYQILEFIAKGSQGFVYKIMQKSTQNLCIAKILKTADEEELMTLQQEFEILQELMNSEYFIKPIEIFRNEENNCIILIEEYFNSENLQDIIINTEEPLNIKIVDSIIRQLLEAITVLHKRKIIHRDINLQNLLYSFETDKLKIIDFGVAKQMKNMNDLLSPNGNPQYSSPEILYHQDYYTEKVDEFGCGLILLSLLENQVIKTKSYQKHLKLHLSEKFEENSLEQKLSFLVKGLLIQDFNQRVSALSALNLYFNYNQH